MSSSELFSERTFDSSFASTNSSRSRAASPSPHGASTTPVISIGSSRDEQLAELLQLRELTKNSICPV